MKISSFSYLMIAYFECLGLCKMDGGIYVKKEITISMKLFNCVAIKIAFMNLR